MTCIGQICNISSQATHITYKIDDGTAIIEVKKWVDPDASPPAGEAEGKRLVEGAYARVWGKMKAFNNKRHLGAHVVRRIEDLNEVQYHLLEAAVVHCYLTKGPPEQLKAKTEEGQGGDAMTGLESGGRTLPPMTANAKRVYNALRSSPQNNEGLHVQNLAAQLGLQISDAMKAGDELLSHGLIFTTVDDETWAILEF